MSGSELKNLLDFFVMCGVDENTENIPTNYYEKKQDNQIKIEKIDNSVSAFVSNPIEENKLTEVATLADLKEKLQAFECDIKKHCLNTVFGIGVEHPKVMVIGEYPNNDADKTGIPFSGEIGQLLDKMLASIGLFKDTNIWLTYLFPYKTPGNRLPTTDEINSVLPFLKKQIELLKPELIITLNSQPLNVLKGVSYNISKVHGEFFEYDKGQIVAIHDPESILLKPTLKAVVWEDLKKIKSVL